MEKRSVQPRFRLSRVCCGGDSPLLGLASHTHSREMLTVQFVDHHGKRIVMWLNGKGPQIVMYRIFTGFSK